MTSDEQKLVPASSTKIEGLDLPSVYVSKFNIVVLDNVGRVVLGEQLTSDHPPHYHSAFLMTHADLEAMAEMILNLLTYTREKKAGEQSNALQALANNPKRKMN